MAGKSEIERRESFRQSMWPRTRALVAPFLAQAPPKLDALATRARALSGQAPVGGNDLRDFPDLRGTVDALIADIDAATHHVHLLCDRFGEDQQLEAALDRATARRVECRVNLESPRALAVIDGKTAYAFGPPSLQVTGPAVVDFQAVFTADWFVEQGQLLSDVAFFPRPRPTGKRLVQLVAPSGAEWVRIETWRDAGLRSAEVLIAGAGSTRLIVYPLPADGIGGSP